MWPDWRSRRRRQSGAGALGLAARLRHTFSKSLQGASLLGRAYLLHDLNVTAGDRAWLTSLAAPFLVRLNVVRLRRVQLRQRLR